jgi:hypothetical protein
MDSIYGCGAVALGVFAYLCYVLMFRLQMRYFELLFTLVISVLPLCLLLSFANNRNQARSPTYMLELILGSITALLIFAGSIWGMSAIRRLKEERQLRRYLLLAAGWGLVVGLLSFLGALFLGVMLAANNWKTGGIMGDIDYWAFKLLTGLSFVCLPGLWIERRCRKLAQEQAR